MIRVFKCIFFFFSSRRRHTRLQGDWSSDVCSSDLFPQRIRVDFGPGITSVVGPNGSGKTNIVEAIRWVLGEQNMRHLRGDTLEDVIFTGSAHRKPLGMAEVSLTMVNNRGVLPSEYTEVMIARRTFRSGQSEYSINRNACRLRDVRDLFLDTGMGSHAYSLIERGMVDNVLSDESGHRRFLFEEAAGIMRYKTRKKEALGKLDLTVGDLTRVNDIVIEIEREVRSLGRQVGKARRYTRLRQEIKVLELEQLKLDLLKREAEVRLAQEELNEREARGAALLNEVAVLRERRTGLLEKLEHAGSEGTRLEKSLEDLRRAKDALEEERTRLGAKHTERARELEEMDAALSAVLPRLESRREALQKRKQLSLDLFQTRVKQQNAAQNWAEKELELTKRKEQLAEESAALLAEERTLHESIETIGRAVESSLAEVERARARVQSETRAIAEIEDQIREHDESEKRAREEHAALESRRNTLREHKDSYEGYDESVRSLVAGPKRPERILGTVGDVLHASGDWLLALEASLGEAVQFIVAERTDAALKALKALEKGGGGRATFIALDRLSWARAAEIPENVLSARGVHGPLLEHVRFEPGFVALASFLLSGVVVVDSMEIGLELMEEHRELRLHYVTRHGEHVRGPGIFQGGGGPTRAGSVLRREEELERLGHEVERSAAELKKTLAHAETLREGRAQTQAALEDANRELREFEETHRQDEAKRAEHRIRLEARVQARGTLQAAVEAVESELKVALVEAEIASQALQTTDEEHGRLEDDLTREEAQVLELERERDRLLALHAELRIESTRAKTAFEASSGEIDRVAGSGEEAKREIAARAQESAETDRRIQGTHGAVGAKEQELEQEIALKAEKEQSLQRSRERFGSVKGSATIWRARRASRG